MTKGKIKVLYCMGSGRSGSTLLGILLSKNKEAFSGGELSGFIDLISKKDTCSCGHEMVECRFWSKVWEELLKVWKAEEIHELAVHAAAVEKTSSLHAWRHAMKDSAHRDNDLLRYYDYIENFFKAIQKVSNKDTIIDISKNPLRAYLLSKSKIIDLRIIHLTRDARGVAWSLNKTKNQAKVYPVWRTALFWYVINKQANRVRKIHKKSVWLRYEDLLREPDDFLKAIEEIAEINIEQIALSLRKEIPNEELHMVAGNKLRKQSVIKLKLDTQWIENMPPTKKTTVSILAFLGLRKYGYI